MRRQRVAWAAIPYRIAAFLDTPCDFICFRIAISAKSHDDSSRIASRFGAYRRAIRLISSCETHHITKPLASMARKVFENFNKSAPPCRPISRPREHFGTRRERAPRKPLVARWENNCLTLPMQLNANYEVSVVNVFTEEVAAQILVHPLNA